jgi:hypothetical protein
MCKRAACTDMFSIGAGTFFTGISRGVLFHVFVSSPLRLFL